MQHLLKEYNKDTKKFNLNIEEKELENNIKFIGKCALEIKGRIANGAIKEVVWKVDTIESEYEYRISKIEHNSEYANIVDRNAFLANKITVLIIKCINSFNLCGLREEMMKNNKINGKCLRCSYPENWEDIVQCSSTIELRKVFIKELLVEMLKNKLKMVNQLDIFNIKEDILKFLNEDDEGNYETC